MPMDDGSDAAFDAAYGNPNDNVEVAHNVSMDGGSTPKNGKEIGPIFDMNEFGPGGTAPRV
jgi:hypothetical protein